MCRKTGRLETKTRLRGINTIHVFTSVNFRVFRGESSAKVNEPKEKVRQGGHFADRAAIAGMRL